MLQRVSIAFAALMVAASPAFAHGGGGGGGGHGGGHVTYVPIFIPGSSVPEVPPAKVGDTSQIHSVAIISAVGQTMTLGSIGWFNTRTSLPIADWKLDDLVDATLRKHLAGRFTFVDVPHDSAALAALPDGSLDSAKSPGHAYLAALPAQGVDAFIVVRPAGDDLSFHVAGLSLDASGIPGRPSINANYEIDIVDAKTLTVISRSFSRVTLRQGDIEHFASLLGTTDVNLQPKQTPTDVQRATMKAEFSHLLSISLIETLRSLELGVALPPPGTRVIVPIPEAMKPFANVKTVAVVSAIGDGLELNHRGTFFVHSLKVAPIADWNLDGEIENQIAAALDKRFTVKPIQADRAAIAKLVIKVNDTGIATPISGLPTVPAADLYIVVLKHSTTWLGLDDLAGVGLWNQTPFGDQVTSLFVDYTIAVVDPHTLRPLVLRVGLTSPRFPQDAPARTIDNALFPKDWTTLSPDQAKALHPMVSELVADSIPETLMRLGLTGMMPSGDQPAAPAPAQ
jgi:hypothetical protein